MLLRGIQFPSGIVAKVGQAYQRIQPKSVNCKLYLNKLLNKMELSIRMTMGENNLGSMSHQVLAVQSSCGCSRLRSDHGNTNLTGHAKSHIKQEVSQKKTIYY